MSFFSTTPLIFMINPETQRMYDQLIEKLDDIARNMEAADTRPLSVYVDHYSFYQSVYSCSAWLL